MKKLKKKENELIKLDINDLIDINGGTVFGAEDSEGFIYFVRGFLSTRDFNVAANMEKRFTKSRHIELSLCNSAEAAEKASQKESNKRSILKRSFFISFLPFS